MTRAMTREPVAGQKEEMLSVKELKKQAASARMVA